MPTEMCFDGYWGQVEYDGEFDLFTGLVEISEEDAEEAIEELRPGWISFHGRDPDELRASFRKALQAHSEAA